MYIIVFTPCDEDVVLNVSPLALLHTGFRGTHLIVPQEGSNNPDMSIRPELVQIPWSIRDR
jgi:hypothetical protein